MFCVDYSNSHYENCWIAPAECGLNPNSGYNTLQRVPAERLLLQNLKLNFLY